MGAFFVVCAALLVCARPLAANAAPTCAPDRIDAQVRVSQVIDGDTVRLSDGQHLRLIGIDTPELAHKGTSVQAFAVEARDYLRQQLTQHQNTLNLRYDNERQDHYGRLLAHAFFADGSSVEAALQTQGFGTVLIVPPNDWNLACYQSAEQQAHQARRGIWALPAYQAVESAQLTPETKDFHLVTGRVRRIGQGNHALWLDLEGGVALRINEKDLVNFRAYSPRELLGKRVLARGWLHRDNGESRMTIRHPAALQILKP